MALGNSNYQDKSNYNNNYAPITVPNYYSRMKIRNFSINLDVCFGYWNGTLVVSIVDTSNKNNEIVKINLSPNKAKVLSECVQKVIDNTDSMDAYGVDTGSGETRGLFAIGRNEGVPFILIGKVNKDGNFESSQRFVFDTNYNYNLVFSNLENLDFIKEHHPNMDLVQLRDILADFARSSNGAYAAATHDINRYEINKLNAMIRGVMQATNAKPVYQNNNNTNRSGNRDSYFNGSSNDNDYTNNNNNNHDSNSNKNNGYQKIDSLEDEFE
jgi:hypothetical protein